MPSTSFQDAGLTIADVQAVTSSDLHSIILLIFCHGIHTCIFFITLYYTFHSVRTHKIIPIGIVAFLWCDNTVIVGLQWRFIDELFITHGTSLEAEYDFYALSGVYASLGRVNIALRALSVFLADVILIWCCWALYSQNIKIVILPCLCLLTEIVSVCFLIVGTESSDQNANLVLIYYAMTVITNSLCTVLILFRIVRISGIRSSLKSYRGLMEILVESAIMYTAVFIVLLVMYEREFYAHSNAPMVGYGYPLMMSVSVTGIAPTLIIARVMAGHSRPNDSWTRPLASHLRSDTRGAIAQSTMRFAGSPNYAQRIDLELGREDVELEDEEARTEGTKV
ncbi:hypothetical protein CPB85DRAFT_1437159 [Mucidula mucida]|nr:hypothetical protein CPB85DRAFT_1437159 [Mucidula mucida]